MAIKLIGQPGSACTLRVIATLNELGLDYELETPDWPLLKEPEYIKTKHPL